MYTITRWPDYPSKLGKTFILLRLWHSDSNGERTGPPFNHIYLEKERLYFRTVKGRDAFLQDMEDIEAEGSITQKVDEGNADYKYRLGVMVRKLAIRRSLNRICKKHGFTLEWLEENGFIYRVAGRW